ncbi:D-aminoacyl-tRNA deacylase [Lycorma delicatula]|uniref:D-aminoacyl-tRNA deacylase n=1 Tax=Lycorma delicatula TaxID=130591 RepID=UPI003F519C45
MRAVIQRVTSANVSVNGDLISAINHGLCVLLSISRNDTQQDMDYMVNKILNIRLFDDEERNRRWAKSVKDRNYEILCISQITLYHTLKGNKPDFHLAMQPDLSRSMFDDFIKQLKSAYIEDKIKEGVFGEYMSVNIQNDGPVTIHLESPLPKVGDNKS